MKKTSAILFFASLFLTSLGYGQYQTNATIDLPQQTTHSIEEIDNQQVNQDEGYGFDDSEYYEAEGINSEKPI